MVLRVESIREGAKGKATTNITKVEKHNPPIVPVGVGLSVKGNEKRSSDLSQTPQTNITASPAQLSNQMLLQMGQMLVAFGGMGACMLRMKESPISGFTIYSAKSCTKSVESTISYTVPTTRISY